MSGGFVTDDKSSVVVEPAVGAFDFVTSFIALKCSTILSGFLLSSFAMRADKFDPAVLVKSFSQWIAVRCFVVQ